ncbi:MAG: DNA methyltransferase, partial [Campylobacterota bacterium]|nr:DNA methyltransferase [Campylobacterota bacterium]
FNLEREKKNETDSKKADGVIYLDNEVVGIIELKGQNTKNLDKVQQQAFWYLTQHSNAQYVIISNFDELRFYFDKSTSYEKFSLFNLDYEDFKKLHLLLSFESIKDKTPLKIKEKTANFEAEISKELYKDFSIFRNHLFENIVKNNTSIEKSILLRLTQKLCDRIIFILFAEDRGLLTANTIKEIRQRHEQDIFGNPMYQYYKIYFDAIDNGNEKLDIPKYNGGLFAKDELLDSLIIDDEILDMEAQKLSDYDFESEVSVNILGHIFEQSLTDLEEIQSNIDNVDFDKTKTKRKKDGVFYTPPYITKYIVDNTLGKMCNEKREELNIIEVTSPKNPKKLTKKEQQTKDNLETYKNWLFNLKILDPACGSGAFLNQALEYLITEHTNLQNDLALMGDLFAVYTVEESVLENNLYGVDINEDATEIAKLSLWLRTAKKGRPLTKLADKIKCGNSLISDKSVVDNAFVWEEEFKEVFEQGGFDIVIGNPPYVRQEMVSLESKTFFKENYETYHSLADLYIFFVEKGINLLKTNGKFSFIIPNKWIKANYGKSLRQWLKQKSIDEIIDFGDLQIFEDATTYPLIMTNTNKLQNPEFSFTEIRTLKFNNLNNYINENSSKINIKNLNDDGWQLVSKDIENILTKCINNSYTLDSYTNGCINRGVMTGLNEAFIIDEEVKRKLIEEDSNSEEIIKPFLTGKDIQKYNCSIIDKWLLYIPWDLKIESYPAIKKHLEQFKDKLESRPEVKGGRYPWYALSRYGSKYIEDFEKIKIIYLVFQVNPAFVMDVNKTYSNNATFICPKEDYFLLGLLNSKLGWFLISNVCTEIKGGYQLIYDYFKNTPIKKFNKELKKERFENTVKNISCLNKKLQETKQNFINELELEKIPKKLHNFENLEFEDFVKEYKKAKKIKFADKLEERNFKNEWKALFENDKKEVLELQEQINQIDKEIDSIVYKLYELTEDEIKIVEDN